MSDLLVLAKIGPFSITRYGLLVVLGALLGIVLTICRSRKASTIDMVLFAGFFAILGARLVYCATLFESFLVDYEEQGGFSYMLKIWEGGYTLWGGILGGMGGIALYAKLTKKKLLPLLDLAAPGAALTLCMLRIAEVFTRQGFGDEIEEEALQFFPIAVMHADEYWVIPVFAWEALAALVVCLLLLKAPRYEGRAAGDFIVFIALTQVILESLRRDEFIRFGFVRFNQIVAAVLAAAVLALRMARCLKAGMPKNTQIWRAVVYLLGVGIVIGIEFALDKSEIPNLLLYIIMFFTLAAMIFACQFDNRRKVNE